MDENRVESAAGKAEGVEGDARKLADKAQSAVSDVTGDTKTPVEGRGREGAVARQEGYGETMARVKEAAAKTAAAIQERPLTIIAAIAAWAFFFGRLTGSNHVHYHHRRS